MSIRITPLTDPGNHRLAWLAADADGTPLGTAFLRLCPAPGQEHLAELTLTVHPAERRQGVGTRLVEAATAAARRESRRSVISQTVQDSPGDHFLRAAGFRSVLALIYTRLTLTEVDPLDLARAVSHPRPGYRLVDWPGTVPEELLDTFVASRRAMDDLPMGDTDYGTVRWDADRVRAVAAVVAERGEHLHTVAAIDETDGSIAGFTELVAPADGTGDAQHYGTAVLPEHRDRGLARWMKQRGIQLAISQHPLLDGLLTDTAADNLPMRRINEALGYRPTHRSVQYQLDLG